MSTGRILVAFASRAGSTAGIAEEVAAVLRTSGLAADCRAAGTVDDVTQYDAVILGSGVFVPSRRSDGGGFLVRHAASLEARPVWLFCAGPIGRGRCVPGTTGTASTECSVVAVADAVGARGAAVFGPVGLALDADLVERLGPVDVQRVRTWAAEIAGELLAPPVAALARAPSHHRRHRSRRHGAHPVHAR